MQQPVVRATAVLLLAISIAACGSRTFKRAEALAKQGDWDAAVAYYTKAVQSDPDRPEYKIALERAMQAASNAHVDKAKAFEAKGDVENAILEYKRASEFAPANTQAAQRRTELERQLRDKAELERKPTRLDAMRAQARRQAEPPILNPTSRTALGMNFRQTAIQDILKFLSDSSGVNIIVEQGAQSVVTRQMTLNVEGLTFEQALNLVMTQNQLWYKVMNERTILVIQDTAQKRQQYEEQIIRTFYISHADTQEMFNLLNQLMRITGMPIQPFVSANKTTNTITVRGTPNVVNILEKVIQANDRPRAEVIIDVEILEVSRERVKQLGLNLSQYNIGAIFSPEDRPGGGGGDDDDGDDAPTGQQFNLNTITQGVSTADFYLTVPSAIVRFMASDTSTRLLAKPQLRGAEGSELELNLGDEVPVPSTTFGGVAAGGVQTVPISSFNYRTVGIVVKMSPRVTFDNEIVLNIEVENSTLGADRVVAGQALPTFGTRKVKTRMRLREGESNLLAGLVREQDRRVLTGLPGLLRVPILKDIFGGVDDRVDQTDIVILMTPRIVRSHELTQENLNPIYIGSQINLGLTGPAPVIADPAPPEPAPAQPPVPPVPQGAVPPPVGPGIPPTATTPQASPTPTTTPGLSPVPPAAQQPLQTSPVQPSPTQTSPAQTSPTQTPPAGQTPPGQTPPGQPPPTTLSSTTPPQGPEPAAQVTISTPGPELRVGGPYTVPISIVGASRLSLISLSVTFNGATLRVRSVQEGPFLRQGGTTVTFANQIDPAGGRVDLSLTRSADVTGASGTGLLAMLIVDATAAGASTFTISGVATTPDGRTVPLTFAPASVTIK